MFCNLAIPSLAFFCFVIHLFLFPISKIYYNTFNLANTHTVLVIPINDSHLEDYLFLTRHIDKWWMKLSLCDYASQNIQIIYDMQF